MRFGEYRRLQALASAAAAQVTAERQAFEATCKATLWGECSRRDADIAAGRYSAARQHLADLNDALGRVQRERAAPRRPGDDA